jgi:hypothetical protein
LAFVEGNRAQMQRAASAAVSKRGWTISILMAQSESTAWFGERTRARDFTERAMDSAERSGAKETAAFYRAAAGLREMEWGNLEQARIDADAASKISPTQEVQEIAAFIFARAGDTAKAQKLADELNRAHPLDTMVQILASGDRRCRCLAAWRPPKAQPTPPLTNGILGRWAPQNGTLPNPEMGNLLPAK